MGIQGLLSYCLRHKEECSELVDLVEVARERGGIEILVDFYSFEHLLLRNCWLSLSRLRQNEYLRILGGEYGSLHKYITKFITDMKSLDISFVFFVDGAKGSSTSALQQKFDTWAKRHEDSVKELDQVLNVLRRVTRMCDLPDDVKVRPVLLEVQILGTLRECGCEVFESVAGEADLFIGRALNERAKAYAVISNDSDFCIFQNSRFIPNELFDLENDLQLGKPAEVPEKPLRLKVRVITVAGVMNMLKLNNHKTLVELSIIAGNDFTGPILRQYLRQKLQLHGGFEGALQWIRCHRNVQNNAVIANEMEYNHQFRSAVYHSRKFYQLSTEPDRPPSKGYFTQLIADGIRQGRLPGNMMGMHNNFYWHRMLVEDSEYGQPCIECALAVLRSYVYRIVLPRQENLVNEYGRSPWDSMRKAGILAAESGAVPPIHHINPDKIFQNLRHFHNIMSHMEQGPASNWFDRYGRKTGFIVYVLRYFLGLVWRQNLHVSEDEFLALATLVFGHPQEDLYQQMAILPPPRCVTIGNWFQDVYRHAYAFLGSLLYIKHEFPKPMEVFCGSAWTVFYMCCKDQTFRMAANQVPLDHLTRAQQHMNSVLKEKRHVIQNITQGFFHFCDR